jgi:MFS family permease
LFLTEYKVEDSTAWASLGQISEVAFMLLLPFFFKKYGFKKTILFGMLAWAIRYALFTYGDAGDLFFMLAIGIALHGICYDFFFVSGQIYTDSKAGEKVKSAAQGLITLATYGVGMLVGFWVAGQIADKNVLADGTHSWVDIWKFPALFALGVFILFAILFKKENVEYKT